MQEKEMREILEKQSRILLIASEKCEDIKGVNCSDLTSNLKKVVSKEVEERLVSIIINFAQDEGLTINNIKEAIEKVNTFMVQNAILIKTT